MKKFLFSLCLFTCFSCDENSIDKVNDGYVYDLPYRYIIIDSCQYIFGGGNESHEGGYFLTHKGNCTNPIHFRTKVTVVDTVKYKLVKE